jgi:hypothetical protein
MSKRTPWEEEKESARIVNQGRKNHVMTKSSIIVGSHFARGAKIVLKCLKEGTRLELTPEPNNPYDTFAILVSVPSENINLQALQEHEAELLASGLSIEEILAEGPFTLGHIASSSGKVLVQARINSGLELIGTIEVLELARTLELRVENLLARISFKGELFVV